MQDLDHIMIHWLHNLPLYQTFCLWMMCSLIFSPMRCNKITTMPHSRSKILDPLQTSLGPTEVASLAIKGEKHAARAEETTKVAITIGNTSNNGGRPRPTCQVCGKVGHTAIKCYHHFDHSYQVDEGHSSHVAAMTPSYQVYSNWYT